MSGYNFFCMSIKSFISGISLSGQQMSHVVVYCPAYYKKISLTNVHYLSISNITTDRKKKASLSGTYFFRFFLSAVFRLFDTKRIHNPIDYHLVPLRECSIDIPSTIHHMCRYPVPRFQSHNTIAITKAVPLYHHIMHNSLSCKSGHMAKLTPPFTTPFYHIYHHNPIYHSI